MSHCTAVKPTTTHASSSPHPWSSSMAASVRGLPLSPPLASSCASVRRLASSPRRRSRGRVSGIRAATAVEGSPRPPEPVEVVGVGSRKDAVIDFCLGSRTLSSTPIRFWAVHVMDNSKVQLIQRSHGADNMARNLEPPLSLHPCPPAVILVASAGQDADQIAALELLSAVKSADKLAASIFLKPFCFEGQRRQVEASDFIAKLQTCSNFYIVIEADSLLETEVETLAEALESANNAVLSTISMISIMMSGFNQMLWSSLNAPMKEVDPEEVGKLLKSYGEARVGFGAGYNIQSAIKQAVLHCPFLRGGIKDLNNVVFLSLASARVLAESDMISTLHIFRRVTGFTKDIIFSRNYEPELEPKLIVVSLLTVRASLGGLGCSVRPPPGPSLPRPAVHRLGSLLEQGWHGNLGRVGESSRKATASLPNNLLKKKSQALSTPSLSTSYHALSMKCPGICARNSRDENATSVKEGFLSSLALHFPFISSLMGGDIPEFKQAWSKHSFSQLPDSVLSSAEQGLPQLSKAFTDVSVSNLFSEEIENVKSERESNKGNGRIQPEFEEANFKSDGEISIYDGREDLSSQQELNFWSNTPGFGIAQLWAKERTTADGSSQNKELDIITLPVGVKSPEVQYDHSPSMQSETPNTTYSTSIATGHAAFGVSLSDVGLEKVMEVCSSAAAFLKGGTDKSRKRGSIANRAALMLDAEREPEKTWSPIVEIQFGAGTYRGRCQEGVPEGKGRLTYSDGSFYDGLWRYGKRSGLGTLYYSNGDVFHGTWRDDIIHGKGWYYFHSGDRWFSNFWKGKANGEGRFYAEDGSIFFGHFQNGWRHGESLLIDANGSRWLEVWDEGLLISRAKLEK